MKKTRLKFTASFKTKVVLEALKERQTVQQLAEKHKLHPKQISAWKKEFLANAEQAFKDDHADAKDHEKEKDELYKQIGQLQVENNWLKKKVL